MRLPADDPWVARGYGQAAIEPGERPAALVSPFAASPRTASPPRRPCGGWSSGRARLALPGSAGKREGHESKLRDVHRRYAEVTSADEVIEYLERVRTEVAA